MTVFRIISIIISIVFMVLATFNVNGLLNENLEKVMNVVGIMTAMLNVISVVMWRIEEKENQHKAKQITKQNRRFRISSHF